MARAVRREEFLINGEWTFHAEAEVEIDTYRNLVSRRGNVESPHLKLSFYGGVMTEINVIRHLGDEAVIKTTTVWRSES